MPTSTLKAVSLLIIATMCWGANITLGRAISADVPPFGLTFWRWIIVTSLLLVFYFSDFHTHWRLLLQHWRLVISIAVTGVCIYPAFQFYALQNTSAINAALFVAMSPVMVPILGHYILGSQISRLEIVGIALSTIGIAIVICKGDWQTLINLRFSWGDLLMLFCTFCWAIYTVLLKRVPATFPPKVLFAATTALAAIFVLPLYSWETTYVRSITLNSTTLLALGYTAIFASLIGYFCFNSGVKSLGPNTAGLFIHLIPLFTTLFAIAFLGEQLFRFHLYGIAAIGSGIILSTWASRRHQSTAAAKPS